MLSYTANNTISGNETREVDWNHYSGFTSSYL